jgi:hypothetical protein
MAGFVELTLEQGADFTTTVTVADATGSPTNLNNYTAAAQLRKSYYSSTAYDFTVSVTSPTTGELTVRMSGANTANLAPGRYVYDLLITSPTNVKTRVIEGIATVLPSVTR